MTYQNHLRFSGFDTQWRGRAPLHGQRLHQVRRVPDARWRVRRWLQVGNQDLPPVDDRFDQEMLLIRVAAMTVESKGQILLGTHFRLLRQETVDMMTRDHLHVIGAEPAGLMLAYQVNIMINISIMNQNIAAACCGLHCQTSFLERIRSQSRNCAQNKMQASKPRCKASSGQALQYVHDRTAM